MRLRDANRTYGFCKVTDLGTGQTYAATDPSLSNGLTVFLADKVQRLAWRYLGGLGKPEARASPLRVMRLPSFGTSYEATSAAWVNRNGGSPAGSTLRW